LSLVAGVVTGGGGKATTTKTKRHAFLRKRKGFVKTFFVCRPGMSRPPDMLRDINQAIARVYMQHLPGFYRNRFGGFSGTNRIALLSLVGSSAISF
jgi:hypothetical protein